jgi:hypothetical protein
MTGRDDTCAKDHMKKDIICPDDSLFVKSDQTVQPLSERQISTSESPSCTSRNDCIHEPGCHSVRTDHVIRETPSGENIGDISIVNPTQITDTTYVSNQHHNQLGHLDQILSNQSECGESRKICSGPSNRDIYASEDLYLRCTLLNNMPNDGKPGELFYCYGCVYRRGDNIDCRDLPMKHELLITGGDHDLSLMKDVTRRVVSAVVGGDHDVMVTEVLDGMEPWLMSHVKQADLYSVEITYKSTNQSTTEACNQVSDTGKPRIPEKSVKCAKLSRHCGYVGVKHDQTVFVLLYLDTLCQIKYDIPDARLLWSQDPSFLVQFSHLTPEESYQFKPLSLYPPLWRHDVSFWENPEQQFSERQLIDVVRDVAGDSLKRVMLRNVWEEPETGRVSRCYRLVYQSYEYAISHTMGHQLQDAARLALTTSMGVQIR